MARGPVTGKAGRLRVARLAPVPANGRSANESRGHAAIINGRQRIADLLLFAKYGGRTEHSFQYPLDGYTEDTEKNRDLGITSENPVFHDQTIAKRKTPSHRAKTLRSPVAPSCGLRLCLMLYPRPILRPHNLSTIRFAEQDIQASC